MNRLRKIALAVLAVCLAVCAGVAVAACDKGGPGIINSKAGYTVTLTSQGGMPLKGVAVSLEKDGKAVTEPILTDKNGSAKLEVDNKGDYDIVISPDTIPAGYTVSANAPSKVTAESTEIKIIFNSQLIKSEIPAGTSLSTGNVMYDFSFTDSQTGEVINLADTLGEKKAVILSFWGTHCPPCRSELPYMQEAYEEYSDRIEIFGLSSYSTGGFDTVEEINSLKNEGNLTFPMGLDHGSNTVQLYTYFNVNLYPTTVVIDRFGVIAYKHAGADTSTASWKALFKRYTSDNYSQDIEIDRSDEDEIIEFTKRPEGISHPSADAVAAAITDKNSLDRNFKYEFEDGYEEDWFWDVVTVDGRDVVRPNSYATDYTYAAIYCTVDLQPGDGLKYDYNVNTLAGENALYVLINSQLVNIHERDSGGWQTCTEVDGKPLYVATRHITIEVCFMYIKQKKVEAETPVYIDNICVYDITSSGKTMDLAFSVVEGLEKDSYGHYRGLDIQLGEDGIYYYTYTDKNGKTERVILYADVLGITYWTERHLNTRFFQTTEQVMSNNQWVDQTTTRSVTLYNVCFWYWDQSLIYKNKDYTTTLYDAYYLQKQCESTVGFVPVTKSFQELLYNFTKQAYESDYKLNPDKEFEYTITPLNFTDEWYEDQWLELCYYFIHSGAAHSNPDDCFRHYNPIAGLVYDTAYEATLGKNEVVISSPVNLTYNNLEAGGGIKYTFTPEESGIYLFTSSHDGDDDATVDDDGIYTGVDPAIIIFDLDRRVEIAYGNDDSRYQYAGTNFDYYTYVPLKAGVTYGITATLNYVGEVDPKKPSKYIMNISKCDEDSIDVLRSASFSSADTWYIDENGNPAKPDGTPSENDQYYYYHEAVKTAYNTNTGYYHAYENGEFGSVIYINFIYQNYFYSSGHSLYDLIYAEGEYPVRDENGDVKYDENGDMITQVVRTYPLGKDLTEKLEAYYLKSIEGKDKNDELYGFIEADREIVNLLTQLIETQNIDLAVERAWERFACYYVYYNSPVD